jgi:3-oxoacyl-ACP reductase-like protein
VAPSWHLVPVQPTVTKKSARLSSARFVRFVQAPIILSHSPSGTVGDLKDAIKKKQQWSYSCSNCAALVAVRCRRCSKAQEGGGGSPTSKSMKDLLGSELTPQSDILGDLNLDFTAAPEGGKAPPLDELGSSLGSRYSGQSGKRTTGLISRLVGGKMFGGFNFTSIKGYLNCAVAVGCHCQGAWRHIY